jgi:hypothetical protein
LPRKRARITAYSESLPLNVPQSGNLIHMHKRRLANRQPDTLAHLWNVILLQNIKPVCQGSLRFCVVKNDLRTLVFPYRGIGE